MTEPRTAKATAARRRQSEEIKAAQLRDRGWTCTPPDEPAHRLRAVLRQVEGAPFGLRLIVGPGDVARAIDVLRVTGEMPAPSADPGVLRRRFEPTADVLRQHGYEPADTWTMGVDQRGVYAATWCRYVGGELAERPGVVRVELDRG